MAEAVQRYVIIGNGIAGTTAADTLRKADPNCSIVLVADEPYTLYNRVALPPFLKLQVPETKVFLRNREWPEKNGIDLHLETRVERVDTTERAVYTNRGQVFPYDRLLVATGGRPNHLEVPGVADAPAIYNFQYLDDAKHISERITDSKVGVVTGGSYIAYELAEAIRARGLDTYWLIRGPRFLRYILEEEGGKLVDIIAHEHGVNMMYGETIAEVTHNGALGVVTGKGERLSADLIGAGLGLTMNYEFLADTPIKTNKGILTDEYLQTNVPEVFSAGDVAEFYDPFTDTSYMMGTWASATHHGRLAAQNMQGAHQPYHDVPYYTSGLFDSRLSAVGLMPDIIPDLEAIHRVDWEKRTYRRLFFRDDRLVGAMLIGDLKPKVPYTQIIRAGEQFPSDKREPLLSV